MRHWVRFYFPFSFSQQSATSSEIEPIKQIISHSLKDLSKQLSLPITLTEKFAQVSPELLTWQAAKYKIEPRFDDHLRKIFSGRSIQPSMGELPSCFQLTSDSVNFLNGGRPGKLGQGLYLTLPTSSINRLNEHQITAPMDEQRWPVKLNDAWCIMLNTGIGVCIIEVCFQSPGKKPEHTIESAEEIQEINYHLARNQQNKQTPQLFWVESPEYGKPLHGLAALVKAIVPPLGDETTDSVFKPLHWENTYTYTVAEVSESITERQFKEQAFRLARKYTDAYIPMDNNSVDNEYRFFDNIVHHFAIEGCCTLIQVAANSPEAIKQFSETACRMAYEPIITLVYSEIVFLRAMTQGSNIDVDLHNPTEAELEQLRHYRTRLYNYRLNSRFAYVSSLTNHNEFFVRLRHVFNIEVLLKELSTDVQEIESFIATHLEEINQRSLNKVKLVGSLVASLVLLTDLTGLNLYTVFYSSPEVPVTMKTLFWCALSTIIIGFVVLFSPLRKK